MGFQFIYLEGGSGARPVPPKIVRIVRNTVTVPLVVGGGIRKPEVAQKIAESGADIVVTGTIVERTQDIYDTISRIIKAVEEGAKARRAQAG